MAAAKNLGKSHKTAAKAKYGVIIDIQRIFLWKDKNSLAETPLCLRMEWAKRVRIKRGPAMAVMTDKINSTECRTDEMTNCPDVIKFNCLARPKARKRPIAGKIIIINCLLSIVCILNNHMIQEKSFLLDHTIYHQDSDFML